MKKSTISIWLFVSSIFIGFAATPVQYDSSSIEWRKFEQEKIEEYKADGDYDYGNRPIPRLSLWERFERWLSELISRLFYMDATTPFGKILVYLAVIAIIVYASLKLFNVKLRNTFYSSSDRDVAYNVHSENIHEMDFDSLIREATANREYKNAIRLIYLAALKQLSDQQFIHWQAGKTNHEYMLEITREDLKRGFGKLSYYFEYAWYGDFPISETQFARVHELFNDWRKAVAS